MTIDIQVPPIGESILEATIGTIFKSSGAIVRPDEEILELETDKVNQVLYASAAGKLILNVKTGDFVKVGQVIGSIEPSGLVTEEKREAPSAPPPKMPPPTLPPLKKEQKEEVPAPISSQATEGRTTRKKMSKLRRVIAERLVEVKNQTAMLTTFNEVDMSAILQIREKEQESFQKRHGVKLGFMSFFIKASIAALQEYPEINGKIEGEEIVLAHYYNIGVAVGTEKGLMVPVLRDADKLSYAQIEKMLKEFAEKARSSSISIEDLQGGTFTITNGGVYGSLLSTPILNPPQSGILGMHNIVKRAVVVNDQVAIRPMMYLALSYDHRIVDGQQSIGFLMHIKKSLEDPSRLLLDL